MPSLSLRRRDPWWEMDGRSARWARRRHWFVSLIAFLVALSAVAGAAFAWAVQLGFAELLGVHLKLAVG